MSSFFDDIMDKAKETVQGVDLKDSVGGFINSYINAQRADAQPLVKIGPDPIQAQLGVLTLASAAVQPVNLAKILPIVAIVGVGAYFIFKKGKK